MDEPLTCDATLDADYRRVSTAGGVDAADDYSILMRIIEAPFVFMGGCDLEMPPGSTGMSPAAVAIIRAWIRTQRPSTELPPQPRPLPRPGSIERVIPFRHPDDAGAWRTAPTALLAPMRVFS